MKFFFFLIFFSYSAWAFKIEPMSAELELASNKQYFNFVISNPSADPLPIQITLMKRAMAEDGDDILSETKDIEAFPDQLIIPPSQKRSVKVSYVGSDKLTDELAYRFIAEQLPLDLNANKKSKSGIKMLLKYVAAFYVVPKDTSSKLHCEVTAKKLICQNTGNKHQILSLKKMKLRSEKNEITFGREELKGILGENILAQSKRSFSFDSKKLNDKKYSVELEFEK